MRIYAKANLISYLLSMSELLGEGCIPYPIPPGEAGPAHEGGKAHGAAVGARVGAAAEHVPRPRVQSVPRVHLRHGGRTRGGDVEQAPHPQPGPVLASPLAAPGLPLGLGVGAVPGV